MPSCRYFCIQRLQASKCPSRYRFRFCNTHGLDVSCLQPHETATHAIVSFRRLLPRCLFSFNNLPCPGHAGVSSWALGVSSHSCYLSNYPMTCSLLLAKIYLMFFIPTYMPLQHWRTSVRCCDSWLINLVDAVIILGVVAIVIHHEPYPRY